MNEPKPLTAEEWAAIDADEDRRERFKDFLNRDEDPEAYLDYLDRDGSDPSGPAQ